MERSEEEIRTRLERLANFGFTQQGSAIVDAIWFSGAFTSPASRIGIVLICNLELKFKAYIGALGLPSLPLREADDAKKIAELGAKVPYSVAIACFPDRFEKKEYQST